MSENGDHVTWRELNLSLAPINTRLDNIASDVKLLLNAHVADEAVKVSRRPIITFLTGLLIASVGALLGTGAWFWFGP